MTADKQSFLDKLNSALLERGVTDADIAPYIVQFDKYYDRMVNDGNAAVVSENIDAIADNIKLQIDDRYKAINRFAESSMLAGREAPDIDDQPTAEADISQINSGIIGAVEAESYEYGAGPLVRIDENGEVILLGGEGDDGEEPHLLPEYVEEPLGDTKKFYTGFFLTLPITLVLLLLGLAVFAGVWAALAVLFVVALVLLAGVAAAGGGVSLIGIVYGVICLFESKAVGMYEIGIGVLVAGISLFVGILLYNLAVRLVPFAARQVLVLFKFTVRKLKQLFFFVRKEVSKP